MVQWYTKQLSELTQISVRTLHHYDAIDLLKPSARLDNGYRLYTEKDLLKLQQIIALKYFGFELSQIKILLNENLEMIDHLAAQSKFLSEKAKNLEKASATLNKVVESYRDNKSIDWETTIALIEVYRMTESIEKTWAGRVLNAEELKEYAHFEKNLKTRFTLSDKKMFEENWASLIKVVEENLDSDPTSELAMSLGKRCMDWVNALYGKKHAGLRKSIWEKGYKAGQIDGEHFIKPEIIAWLDKAIDTYYRSSIYRLLDQVNSDTPKKSLIDEWESLMEDMYGDVKSLKADLVEAVLQDTKVSATAKDWVKNWIKSQA